jgi:hypothetical protein
MSVGSEHFTIKLELEKTSESLLGVLGWMEPSTIGRRAHVLTLLGNRTHRSFHPCVKLGTAWHSTGCCTAAGGWGGEEMQRPRVDRRDRIYPTTSPVEGERVQPQVGERQQPPTQRVHHLVRHAVTHAQPLAGGVVDSAPPPTDSPHSATPPPRPPAPLLHDVHQHPHPKIVRQPLPLCQRARGGGGHG